MAPEPEEGNMEKHISNFPVLFDRIGYFLERFIELQKKRTELSPAAFAAELDKLFQANSPSAADEAYSAWEEIVDTIYYDRASRGCLGGSTKMRG